MDALHGLHGLLGVAKGGEADVPLAAGTEARAGGGGHVGLVQQQIEELQDGKRLLYERYLLGEIDLDTYKAEKAACDELLLKTKNAYAVVLAQAKQKQEEQARHDNRQEAARAVFNSEGLTAELTDLLIDRVLVYPDNRIEIAYKIKDIFD